MAEEIWKPVDGFEEYLEVSSRGRVKRKGRWLYNIGREQMGQRYQPEKIVLPGIGRSGYPRVRITISGQKHQWDLHRLVALTFVTLIPAFISALSTCATRFESRLMIAVVRFT